MKVKKKKFDLIPLSSPYDSVVLNRGAAKQWIFLSFDGVPNET